MKILLVLSLIVVTQLGFINCSSGFRGATAGPTSDTSSSAMANNVSNNSGLSLASTGANAPATPAITVSGIWNNDTSGTYSGDKALDGNTVTRWASNFAGNAATWIHLDYGQLHLVQRIDIVWETAGSYKIEISLDGVTYHKAASGITAFNSTSSTDLTGNQWGGLYGRYLRISPDKTPAEESQYRSIYEIRIQQTPAPTASLSCEIAGEPLAPTCDYKPSASVADYAISSSLDRYTGLFDHNFAFHPSGNMNIPSSAVTYTAQPDTAASCMERCRTFSAPGSSSRHCAFVASPNGAATECLILTDGTNSACMANLRFKSVPSVNSAYSRAIGIRCK